MEVYNTSICETVLRLNEYIIEMNQKNKFFLTDNQFQWLIIICMAHGILQSLSVIFVLLTTKWSGFPSFARFASLLLFHVLLTTTFLGYSMWKPLQQILLIGIYWIGMSSFFKKKVSDVDELWKKYLLFTYFAACAGLFQLLSLVVAHFDPFFFLWEGAVDMFDNGGLRIHSFFGEPATFATFMVPAVCYRILNFKEGNFKRDLIVFLSFVLTFSAAAFVAVFCFVLYRIIHSRYKLVPLFLIPIIVVGLMTLSKKFEDQEKSEANKVFLISNSIFEIGGSYLKMDPDEFEVLSPSLYATLTNLWVSIKSPFRIVGTGIGTHQQNYEALYPDSGFYIWGLNRQEAYALGTRLFSEFGLLGIMVVFLLLKNYANKENFINISIFFYILTNLIRGGHYAANGLFFFIILYYLTSKKFYGKKRKENMLSING